MAATDGGRKRVTWMDGSPRRDGDDDGGDGDSCPQWRGRLRSTPPFPPADL